MPGVGFALHLDAVARAREAAGVVEEAATRAVVAVDGARGEAIAEAIRAAGITAVRHAAGEDPAGYAEAWGFSQVVTERAGRIVVARGTTGGKREEVVLEDGREGEGAAKAIRAGGSPG
jgi:hypothetical protein